MAYHLQDNGLGQPAVGQFIRELRQVLRLTQEKLAVQLGVTFPTINRWENGHTTPSPLALQQIKRLLSQHSESPDVGVRQRCQEMHRKYFS